MKILLKLGRYFFAAALVAYAIRQFIYSDFRDVFLPMWPAWLPGGAVVADIFGAGLISAAVAIVLNKKGKEVSLVLGGVLLVLFIFCQVPYEIFVVDYWRHLGAWVNPLKELALSGCAFVVAWTFTDEGTTAPKNSVIKLLEKLIPFGGVFFSITMISFGITHFMYMGTVAAMVPSYFPDHEFWAYFAAVALICTGVAIILKIRVKRVTILAGIMLFIWFAILHLPGAFADPVQGEGNLFVSAFDALAFSGTAFMIACGYYKVAV